MLLFMAAPHLCALAQSSLAPFQSYEQLRKPYDRDLLKRFFLNRPLQFADRLKDFSLAYWEIRQAWSDDLSNQHLDAKTRNQKRGTRLRDKLAQLGPVAVKLGQTLSQRPDLLDEAICEELKSLQTANAPFDTNLAMAIIADAYDVDGPIAPGVLPPDCRNASAPPLLASIQAEPIACASLGQVYKGKTWNGTEVAIKVQRPSAMRQVALDFAVIVSLLYAVQLTGWGNGDLVEIVDIVAAGVFEELDYRNEAANVAAYAASLDFLGYVSVPSPLTELPPTPRVIMTEWIVGRHLSDLNDDEGRIMVEMAIDSVTASLVLTGLVHADPHEGNIMLGDDGRLYFLDFGLMSVVEPRIMEAFAEGIMCVLNKDWRGLVDAFIATGFVGTPIEYRAQQNLPFSEGSPEDMALELQERMESVAGGTSRFGALSTVLFEMGNLWRMYTPPYIILLIRTFLTLEGIAAKIDPNFNIYEYSLPWAVQRALSPSTLKGKGSLRSTILDANNILRWERVEEFIEESRAKSDAQSEGSTRTDDASYSNSKLAQPGAEEKIGEEEESDAQSNARSGKVSVEAFSTLLGSPEGKTLRRIANDLDSTDLIMRLVSRDARPLRRMGVEMLTKAFSNRMQGTKSTAPLLPTSSASEALKRRRATRLETVTRLLVRVHLRRQVLAGWRGVIAFGALFWVVLRVGVVAILKALIRNASAGTRRALVRFVQF